MASNIDYYASLSRAVAGLDRDSYAARGAIYDREYKALLRQLFSADPPHTDAEIEREQNAFRDAIRRGEFGNEDAQVSLVPQREPVPELPEMVAVTAPRGEPAGWPARTAPMRQKSSRADSPWPRLRVVPQEMR